MERAGTFHCLLALWIFSNLLSSIGGTSVTDREGIMPTPMTTIPIIVPLPPPAAFITPTTPFPSTGGAQSWCVASQTASQAALQVALDYACGFGGADCAAIQPGGACFYPDTLSNHASYAFNSYYTRNPIPTSCDFGGAAVLTTVDPSSAFCRFPASSPVVNVGGSPPGPSSFTGSTPPTFDDSSAIVTCPSLAILTLAAFLFALSPLTR